MYGVIFALILLCASGSVYAYIKKIGPFSGPASLYNESNFMSGLLAQSSKINTSSYSISASLGVGPRDADAKPFVLPPLSEEFLKKYQNDVTRMKDSQSILSAILYRQGGYPSTLSQLKSGNSSYYYGDTPSFVDPVTSQMYVYTLIDGGKNFNLTVTLETKEAISAIRSSYGFKAENTLINGQTITFTKDSPSYIYISGEPPKPLFATLGEGAQYLPAEFGANLTFSAQTDWQTTDLADWSINIDANGDFGDLVYKINLDALKKGADYYLKINNIPSLFLGSFSNLKGQWIKITPKKKDEKSGESFQSYDPLSSIVDSFSREEISYKENRAEVMQLMKQAAEFADQEKLISFGSKPAKEKLGDRELYRYDLAINRDAILPFYRRLLAEAEKTKNFKSLFEDSGLLAYLETPEFNNVFDYYQSNTFLSIWVDKEGFPASIKYGFRLVPPDSAAQLKDKQANLALTLNISDINKPISIQTPEGAQNIEDLPAFKTARAKSTNASIKANLSNMRVQAELYYDSHSGSYGAKVNNSCAATIGTLFSDKIIAESIANIQKTMNEGGIIPIEINCYSKKSAWAASVKLLEDDDQSGYWCVDSAGSSKLVKTPTSSTSCPK